MIELNHTELATQEDKAFEIDKWAKLFKAKTWEEIKMITKDNPSMNSTAESIYLSDADFLIREQCRRREDAIAHEKYQKELIESLQATIAKDKETIANLQAELDHYKSSN